jgi:hypothetical protein
MAKPPLAVFRFVAFLAFALPVSVHAQAIVEYAGKSAGSAVSGSNSHTIAGCPINSALLNCLNEAYPRMIILGGIAICVLVFWLFSGARRRVH